MHVLRGLDSCLTYYCVYKWFHGGSDRYSNEIREDMDKRIIFTIEKELRQFIDII